MGKFLFFLSFALFRHFVKIITVSTSQYIYLNTIDLRDHLRIDLCIQTTK